MRSRILRMVKRRSHFWPREFSSSVLKPKANEIEFPIIRRENDYFYRVMASKPAYYVGKTTDVEVKDAPEIVHNFLRASPQTMGDPLMNAIVNAVPRLSPTNVQALLLKLHSWMLSGGGFQMRNGYQLLTGALIKRSEAFVESEQSLELEFTLADLFYRILLQRTPFHEKMLQQQSSALKYLTETDFIQHLFFCNTVRALPPKTAAAVPIFIDNVVEKLDLDEVALICYALYKCQYSLEKLKQWMTLVNSLEKHQGPIPNLALGCFAKYFRYQHPKRVDEHRIVKKFLDMVSPRLSEWDLHTHLRIANAGTQVRMCDAAVVTSSVDKLISQLDTCRVKDIAMCLYTNAFFDFEISRKNAEVIIKRLRSLVIENEHHRWLITATMALAVLGFYDNTLFIRSLDPDVINFNTTHQLNRFETCALYTTCKIKFPQLLEDKIRLRDDHLEAARQKVSQVTDCSKRHASELQHVRDSIHSLCHLKTELVQTLDSFAQRDIHVETGLVIVCHPPQSYTADKRLLGFKRFRVALMRQANYHVAEIDQEFFHFKKNHQAWILSELIRKNTRS